MRHDDHHHQKVRRDAWTDTEIGIYMSIECIFCIVNVGNDALLKKTRSCLKSCLDCTFVVFLGLSIIAAAHSCGSASSLISPHVDGADEVSLMSESELCLALHYGCDIVSCWIENGTGSCTSYWPGSFQWTVKTLFGPIGSFTPFFCSASVLGLFKKWIELHIIGGPIIRV
jgi:hypothetical protein